MRDRIEKATVVLHVRKTGGTTLRKILKRKFPPEECWLVRSDEVPRWEEILSSDSFTRRILMGHIPWGLDRSFTRPTQYVTLLRDPAQRVLSHFFHYKLKMEKRGHPTSWSLVDFLSSAETGDADVLTDRFDLDNGMTRQFSGAGASAPFGKCTRAMLEKAKENLDKFALVGTTERFDETILLMGEILKWKGWPFYYRQNVSRRGPNVRIGASQRGSLEKYIALDRELYETASALITRKLQSQEDRFRRKVFLFRLINRFSRLFLLPERFKRKQYSDRYRGCPQQS